MRILAWERSSMENDIVSVKEILWNVGRLVWVAWVFGISSYVDSSKSDLSSIGVSEVPVLDCKSQGRHDIRGTTSRSPMSHGAVSLL
jgi:hypothetical protein